MPSRAPLQNQTLKKDIPEHATFVTVTNGSTKDAMLPFGTHVPPGSSRNNISAREWAETPTATRTAFALTAV